MESWNGTCIISMPQTNLGGRVKLFILILFVLIAQNTFAQSELRFKNDTMSFFKIDDRIRMDNACYEG